MKRQLPSAPSGFSQLNKEHRRRKWWQQAVSFMAAIVVFCTTYSLILNAITQELSPDPDPNRFMINGSETDGTYTWENAEAGVSAEVTLHGNARYVGELPDNPDWRLSLSFKDIGSREFPYEQNDGDSALPLMAFNMKLQSDDGNGNTFELLLDSCTADVTLRLRRELVESAVEPLTADAASDGDAPPDTPLALSVRSGEGELTGVELPIAGDWVTLTYSVRANDTVTTVLDADPHYLLQHHLYLAGFETTYNPGTAAAIPFRNMSTGEPMTSAGGIDPNGKIDWSNKTEDELKASGKLFYLLLDENGSPKSKTGLYRLLTDESTHYRENPQVRYMNRLYNGVNDYNSNYKLAEIWITTDTGKKDSVDPADFTVYDVRGFANPDRIRFTNNPNNSHIGQGATDSYPYDLTIRLPHNSVVRLVFDYTTSDTSMVETAVNFFDYNIGDGYIYKSNASSVLGARHNTSEQTVAAEHWAMKTNQQGVNSPAAFDTHTYIEGEGQITADRKKFIFGNRGSGNQDLADRMLADGTYFNRANGANFQGATFNLVQGLRYGQKGLPVPLFSDEVLAPDLFSSQEYVDANGFKWKNGYITQYGIDENGEKTETSPYKLGFFREGGTYTLSYVKDESGRYVASDLMKFKNIEVAAPWIRPSGIKTLYSNEFWPMDGSPSHGTDGNDMKFGSKEINSSIKDISGYRHFNGGAYTGTLPVSDMALAVKINGVTNTGGDYDHNAYFGMSFTRTFTVEPGYRSPMNYWFYGDDDLWVFLEQLDEDGNPISAEKIADLGGVHSSVGEYVNLWDYIDPVEYGEQAETYRLTVFYLERGASGSCCYMRIVLPLTSRETTGPNRNEALVFEKQELDDNGNPVPYDANGKAYDFELRLFNEHGADFEDIYDYTIYRSYEADGTRTDHTKYDNYTSGAPPDVLVSSGVLMTEGQSGTYRFSLRSGEYIVIRNLPGDAHSDGIIGIDTYYSVRELRTEQDRFVTQYCLGTHTHDNGLQVDTPESAARYDYSVGMENRIHLRTYNYVYFVNAPLLKTEYFPGNGKVVLVDEEIVYEIEWANDTHVVSDIIVTDPLDEGVDFIGASFYYVSQADALGKWWMYDGAENEYTDSADDFTIMYDPVTHTVTYRLKNREAESFGIVSLKVRVNRKALAEENDTGSYGTATARVENYATVQIGNRLLTTNKVENPIWGPLKDEPTPGAGATVFDGDELFYTVTWRNYFNEPAAVTVRDPLDERVSYLIDTAKVYYGKYGSDDVSQLESALIAYDAETHTLRWDLGVQPAGAYGYVCFSVKVNETDAVGGIIRNVGYVKVGDDRELETNRINNPIYGYLLPSTGGVGREVYPKIGSALIFLATALLIKGRISRNKKKKIYNSERKES